MPCRREPAAYSKWLMERGDVVDIPAIGHTPYALGFHLGGVLLQPPFAACSGKLQAPKSLQGILKSLWHMADGQQLMAESQESEAQLFAPAISHTL